MRLILASTSPIRQELLRKAGVEFELIPPEIDEALLKSGHAALDARSLAGLLADTKAVAVSARYPDATVIGADQILNLDGMAYGKPDTIEEADLQLRNLRGRSHTLETALSCAEGGSIVWRHLAHPTLTMRNFSDEFLAAYLESSGPGAMSSAGSYQLEARGVQLFEAIEADYFAILGLPLLPLFAFLRDRGLAPS